MADKLTPKQQAFITAYLKTGNATQAYVDAYNVKRNIADASASRLLGNVRVAAEIARVQAKVTTKAELTLQAHLDRLEHLSIAAESADQYGAAINAENLRGKVSGFYVEKVEHSGSVDLSQSEREQAVLGILTGARKRQKELVS